MIKDTIKRLKAKNPKYFQKWFWIMVFTTVLSFASELEGIKDTLPATIQSVLPYIKVIGLTGMFFSRLPNEDKK